jgi:hypothetical protein
MEAFLLISWVVLIAASYKVSVYLLDKTGNL